MKKLLLLIAIMAILGQAALAHNSTGAVNGLLGQGCGILSQIQKEHMK